MKNLDFAVKTDSCDDVVRDGLVGMLPRVWKLIESQWETRLINILSQHGKILRIFVFLQILTVSTYKNWQTNHCDIKSIPGVEASTMDESACGPSTGPVSYNCSFLASWPSVLRGCSSSVLLAFVSIKSELPSFMNMSPSSLRLSDSWYNWAMYPAVLPTSIFWSKKHCRRAASLSNLMMICNIWTSTWKRLDCCQCSLQLWYVSTPYEHRPFEDPNKGIEVR